MPKIKQFAEWEKEKQQAAMTLAQAGVLYPYFLGKQREIYTMFHTLKPRDSMACILSRKMGKSYMALLLQIEMCNRHEGFIARHMLPSLKQARDVVYPILSEMQTILPKSVLPYTINRSDGVIRFRNGSQIVIGGMQRENIDSSRGPRSDLMVCDEVGFVDNNIEDYKYALYSVLLPQLTVSKFALQLYITTPPHDPSHPFLDITLPPVRSSGKHIQYTINDSPFLDEADIDELAVAYGGKNSPDWKREMECEVFADQSRRVTPEFATEKHVVGEVAPSNSHMCYLAADLGLSDNSAFLGGYFDFDRQKLVITDEITTAGKSLGELSEDFKSIRKALLDKYSYNPLHIKATIDVFEIAAHSLRVDHGLNFVRPIKRRVEDSVALLRKWVKEDRIEIHKSCTNTIYELGYGCWSETHNVNKEFERNSHGHLDHIAALMYMVRLVNPRYMPGDSQQLSALIGDKW
jgi:hypothetical protein